MSAWPRRRTPPAPPRTPHPDPEVELQLQRILDLRASITRRAALADQYRHEIGKLHSSARGETSVKRAEVYLKQAGVLHQRVIEVEQSISPSHEEIAVLTAKLESDDRAYL